MLKIKITSLKNATCWVNSGGTMLTSTKQVACKEGDEFSFGYSNMTQDQNIFLVSYATFIKPVVEAKPAAPPALFAPTPLVTLKAGSTAAETTAALTKFFYDVTGFAPTMSNAQLTAYVTKFYTPKGRLLATAAAPAGSSTAPATTPEENAKTLLQAALAYANDQFTRYDTNSDKSVALAEFNTGFESDLAKGWTQVSYINDFRLLSGDAYTIDLAKLAKSDNAKYVKYAPTDTKGDGTVDFLEYTVWRVAEQKKVRALEEKADVEAQVKAAAELKAQ